MDQIVEAKKYFCSPQRYILLIVGMVLLTTIIVVAILRDRIVNKQYWQVSVSGRGSVIYQPDEANITMGVQIDKVAKADQALTQLNEKINSVIKAIEQVGVPKENIKTQNYSLTPQYDWIENVQTSGGFTATQLLVVKVMNLSENNDLVSQVIDVASKAGVNQIQGVSFDTSKLEDLKQQARLKAIANAKSQANSIAGSLEVRLGKVIGWWENSVSVPGTSYYEEMGAGYGGGGGAPVVPGGSQEIIMEVSINYEVK
jgi:uncharacterized protein YggE